MLQKVVAKHFFERAYSNPRKVLQFPVRNNKKVVDATRDLVNTTSSISKLKGTHISVSFANYVVYEQPYYNFYEEIIECALSNSNVLSVELPNDAKLGCFDDASANDMVINKYNREKVRVFKVYHFDDRNPKFVSFKVSEDIRKAIFGVGVHLKQDAVEMRDTTHFVQSCRLALANCYDNKKHVEVMIEVNNDRAVEELRSALQFYGEDMYYKVRLVVSPCYHLEDNFGFEELQVIPYDDDWLTFFKNNFIDKRIR